MYTKPIFAALVLFAGIAHASPRPADAEFVALESGIPDSTSYADRAVSRRSPSNDEIGRAESGNPDSVDYARRITPAPAAPEGWLAAEFGNPDFR